MKFLVKTYKQVWIPKRENLPWNNKALVGELIMISTKAWSSEMSRMNSNRQKIDIDKIELII